MRIDGVRHRSSELVPGSELGIGGVTLVAESIHTIALRGFVGRIIGWGEALMAAIDHSLRTVRMATAHRAPLVLRGEGDLVPVARSLHHRALGPLSPFVVCDPRRRQGGASVRGAENYETGAAATHAATGGWLCIRSQRRPRDFAAVVDHVIDPNSRVQLVLCVQPWEQDAMSLAHAILVPSLATRQSELDKIVLEYAEDAIAALGTARTGFTQSDREWVRMHSATSLPDIEKATLRLVAIRESRNLSHAAHRLGMAPVSLTRWIGRRKLPI